MPRPKKIRKINNPPLMKGFKPFGVPFCKSEMVTVKFEEFESIKLINYLNLSHEEAANRMNVSRPTFTRIYNRALKQIAESFVEGKPMVIEGGNYCMEDEWFRCKKCHRLIQGIENHLKCRNCESFGDNELIKLNSETDKT